MKIGLKFEVKKVIIKWIHENLIFETELTISTNRNRIPYICNVYHRTDEANFLGETWLCNFEFCNLCPYKSRWGDCLHLKL